MKKIINGLKYDTDSAELICEDSYSNKGDFHWYEEALYITKKGNYFVAGAGGALSKYNICCGQGEFKIMPLSKEEAFEFCSSVDTHAAEKFFSDMIEEA